MRAWSRSVLVGVLSLSLLWSGSELAQAKPTPPPTPSPGKGSSTVALRGLSSDTKTPIAAGVSGEAARATAPRSSSAFDASTSRVVSRAARSTVYKNADGSQTAVFADDDVNYQDAAGAWQAIDNSVVTDTTTGDLVNKANGWQVRFGDSSTGLSFKRSPKAAGVVVFTPVGSGLSKPKGSGSQVTYSEVWPGVDLMYELSGSAVKETVLIRSRSAGSSFTFQTRAGGAPDVKAGKGAAPSAVVNADGSVTLTNASSGPVTVSAPMVVDVDGVPLNDSGAKYSVGAGGKLTLSVDPGWLASLPATAFPIRLDPSLSSGSTGQADYKSDGYSCSNCGLRIGNSRDNGDKYWRSMTGYNWSGMAGTQIVDASISVAITSSGTLASRPVSAYWAGGFSYGGTTSLGLLATGYTGYSLGGPALVSQVQSWANQGSGTQWIGFVGDESRGSYTFQVISTTLYVTYGHPSAVTSLTPAMTQGKPPVVSTTTPTLSAVGSDPDGPVQYNFTISGGSDIVNGKASSGWQSGSSWQVPYGVLEEGQQYSWSVSVRESANQPMVSASSVLKVDRRMGSGGPSPMDSLGGASVNLANGNLYLSASGHGVSSVGGSLAVGLTYNSQLAVQYGLVGSYYQETDRNWKIDDGETPSLVRVDSAFDMAWNTGAGVAAAPPGMAADQFLAHWVGYLTVPADGTYQFGARSDDGVRISVAGTQVLDDWTAHGVQTDFAWTGSGVALTANQPVKISIDYYNSQGPGVLQIAVKSGTLAQQLLPGSWLTPGVSTMPAGWSVTLPGGGNSYTKASVGYQAVVLTDSTGAGHTYLQTSAEGYQPPAGEAGVLTGSSSTGWTLNDSDGSVYTFNAQGQPTSAQSATDATHPAAATYIYDTTVTPARITTIHDPVSTRDITLTYGTTCGTDSAPGCVPSPDCPAAGPWGLAPLNLLCKVTYWDGTATVLHYTNGQLAAVEEPGSAVTQFGYTDGLLSQVRGVLANDLITAGKIAATDQTFTAIGYTWVQAATVAQEATNIRPPYVQVNKTNGVYPAGAIPLVTKVTGPAPDGVTEANRSEHTYDYSVNSSTTKVSVKGIATTASTVTYDGTGRTQTTQTAANPKASSTWDTASKDLQVTSTDPAGRMSTTVYDWADRVTDTFGPAPAACFDATTGKPISSTGDCANIPHSHTGYDTDQNGARLSGASLDQFASIDLTGQPSTRSTTTTLDPSAWPTTATGTSSRLTGEIALSPATYTFSADLADKIDDGIRVYVGDTLVVDRWWTLTQAVKADSPDKYWSLGSSSPTVGTMSLTPLSPVSFTGGSVSPVDQTPSAYFPNGGGLGIVNAFDNMSNSPTVELWFRTGASGVLIGQEDATDTTYAPIMYIGSDGKLRASFWTTSGSLPIATTGDVRDNQWHHALLSTSQAVKGLPSFQTLYLDGTLVGTKADPPAYETMHRIYLGAGITTGWPAGTTGATSWTGFYGTLAHVAIYNHPLGPTAAARHYQAGTASLTGTAPVTFAAASAVVSGTLPVAPVSTPQRVRVEYRNIHQTATAWSFTLKATPSGGSASAIPVSALSTRYGLATWQTTDDSGGVASGKLTTATRYDGSGLDLQYGLATSTVADPAGIAVTTSTAYEAPSATTYLRVTGSALSSGSVADPLKSTTTVYYGDTETRANPCVAGSAAVNQAGLAKLSTKPKAADGTQISEESVYDAAGRVVAARYVGDGSNWTCTSYDVRGRVTSVTTPAFGSDTTARTVTTTYAVNGDARVSSVSDGAGMVTGTTDLLGRAVSYTDASGVTTSTSYDVAGRTTSVATVAGGVSSTVGYSYRDDGQVSTVTVDGATVATVGYDATGEVSGVTYPFGTLGGLLKYPSGAGKGDTWTVSAATARTFTETITRSQSGRVTGAGWTDSAGAATGIDWTYSYDNVGRLTQAVLAAVNQGRSQVSFGYSFAKTGGCGADTAAGANGSRTGSSVQVGTGTVATSTYCYDYASRLTSVSGANPISTVSYDGHGNATRIGDQTWTYDAADRVSGAGVVSTGESLVYTRDVTGRVIKRVATGPDAGTTRYGFTTGDDSPDVQLDTAGKISERYLSLPGGVLVTKPYAAGSASSWSIPNWHGDITAQASISSTGTVTVTGAGWVADPYGQPLNQTTGVSDTAATASTRTGTSTTDAWLGQHQRGYEHTAGLNQMLMGARTYLPALGIFTSTDPVPGGSATDYDYANQDPVNQQDISGLFGGGLFGGIWDTVKLGLSVAAMFGCVGCGVAALVMSAVDFGVAMYQGNKTDMLLNALDFVPVAGKVALLVKAERAASVARNAKSIYKGLDAAGRAAVGSASKLRKTYHAARVAAQRASVMYTHRVTPVFLGVSYAGYRRTYGGGRD